MTFHRLTIGGVAALLVLVGCVGLGSVRSRARAVTANITVVNNSNWQVRNLYLSPPDSDAWGPEQLNGTALGTGQSVTLSNVSCDQANIKIIAEDMDGCFISKVTACSGDSTATITNDLTRDCGSN